MILLIYYIQISNFLICGVFLIISTLVNFLNYWVCYPPLFYLIGYVTHPFFILKFEKGILHFVKAQLRELERKTYIITFNHGPS